MTPHPLSRTAVEAAMQTLFELPGFRDPPSEARKIVNNIISAAFEQARVEGNARNGKGIETEFGSGGFANDWLTSTDATKKATDKDFPVTIIKDARHVV